jgi:lactate racemase
VERTIVSGSDFVRVKLPDDTQVVGAGVSLPLDPAPDLAETVVEALRSPLDTPPLVELVSTGSTVTIAFDDPTVPCYAPLWGTALPLIVAELEGAGVKTQDISFVCANALHRKFSHEELAGLIGESFVSEHRDRISCHDAEDPDNIVKLGQSKSGLDVELNRAVVDSDLTIYLNCSTTRGFSGGWKSVCVGLSTYKSIAHHHTPDIMSMSLDRNRMHAMLDEMGSVVETELGKERIFKLETVLANPLAVHTIYAGTVGATRAAALDKMRAHQPPRRALVEDAVDIVLYGVPDWSPYAAFSHNNPILDLISTGLGYLGGMIEAVGKKGCTVVLATPCKNRWDEQHHASYPEVWETVIPKTKDPEVARLEYEPLFAEREDYIDKYRRGYSFHPVHAVMALYPLKRLRHAEGVIVAGAEDPAVPQHCGFGYAPTVEEAVEVARDIHGADARIALIDYPMAFNRS